MSNFDKNTKYTAAQSVYTHDIYGIILVQMIIHFSNCAGGTLTLRQKHFKNLPAFAARFLKHV